MRMKKTEEEIPQADLPKDELGSTYVLSHSTDRLSRLSVNVLLEKPRLPYMH